MMEYPLCSRDHAAIVHLVQNGGGDFVDEEYSRLRIVTEKFYGFLLLLRWRLLFFAFNSSQVAVLYFVITLSAAKSNSMPCADAPYATIKAEIIAAAPIDLFTSSLLSC